MGVPRHACREGRRDAVEGKGMVEGVVSLVGGDYSLAAYRLSIRWE